jgi:hypothetical protein
MMASGKDAKVRQSFTRILKLALALVLIVLGLAGLVLPLLQGILFLVMGLLLLADAIPSVRAQVTKLERRNEKVAKVSAQAHRHIDALFERLWLVVAVLLLGIGLIVWGILELAE